MPIISRPVEPFIPEFVTVHLGAPDQPAENVTVTFPNYIKNVASSEIFPTWPDSAIRANIYAIISFTLNRIYTEWYRSRGYDFDITNNTQFDQSFSPDREIFGNISQIVDDIFNSYIRKEGSIEPAFTAYCDGVNTKCDGLSQWGTVDLANAGKTPIEILKNYYGDDIEIVSDVPVNANFESYPGYTLKLGSFGNDVRTIQKQLNRIRENYPSIPKIEYENGFFGVDTEAAVKAFQKIFNLTQDGIVGTGTWYKIKYIYTGVKDLGELISEGIAPEDIQLAFPVSLEEGDSGNFVRSLQYYLRVISCVNPNIPKVEITGYFGPETTAAVKALEKQYGIMVDGVVGIQTFAVLEKAYKEAVQQKPKDCLGNQPLYPGFVLSPGMENESIKIVQEYLKKLSDANAKFLPVDVNGKFDGKTVNAILNFQKEYGIPQSGIIGPSTWHQLSIAVQQLES